MTRIQKIGRNRGTPRIWIEGKPLSDSGWTHGTRFDCTFREGSITYTRNPSGARAVAGTKDRPIIDTNSARISQSLGQCQSVSLDLTPESIHIIPAPSQ